MLTHSHEGAAGAISAGNGSGLAPTGLPAIRACLFDMDGLLIDSEDLYTHCTNAVLQEYGRPNLPWNIKAQMQGRPGPTAGAIFQEWAKLPVTREVYMEKIAAQQRKLFPSTKPLPGVQELLETLSKKSDVEIALATSSHEANFHLKTDHQKELFEVFQQQHRVLGDDKRIAPGRGKPAPDIYLLALETINTRLRREHKKEIFPEECLVFEDSVPGVESGRRAGMQVVWCPHPELLAEFQGREKEVLAGLTGEHKEDDEAGQTNNVPGETRRKGAPGELDDGWGVYLKSLENFPYERFGIKV